MANATRAPLRVGLLNMMADGALKATERQFRRLLAAAEGQPAPEICVFSIREIPRSDAAHQYISATYLDFSTLKTQGLDALIITGVNLMDPRLEIQPFWNPLQEVFAWAEQNVISTMCSCLSTHAVLQFHFGKKRKPLPEKLWGVFSQEVQNLNHPLVQGVARTISVPHSRHNDIDREQFQAAGLDVLVFSGEAGVHLAVNDDMKLVLMQGHPEYDSISLLKEYKREVSHFMEGLRPDYPAHLVGLMDPGGLDILDEYRQDVLNACELGRCLPEFPESTLEPHLINHWAGPTAQIFRNWVKWVAQKVH